MLTTSCTPADTGGRAGAAQAGGTVPTRVRAELRGGRVTLPELRAGDTLVPRVLAVDGPRVRLALVGRRATLLAGDRVEVDVEVGAGVRMDIVEPSGTVAYDARGGRAGWVARIGVAPGGAVTWRAAPLVVADGADVRRELDVRLADGAVALLSELLVLGRSGQAGGALFARQRVQHAGELLLADDLDLRDPRARARPAILGPNRVIGTVALLGRPPLTAPAPPAALLAGPGALARVVARDAHQAQPELDRWWHTWCRLQDEGIAEGS
ncbi:urease accessory protein UreD [Streptomyces sp. NPDC002795]|uniref:urease accessory protein UreD n=1 Tax=Streptomyces sp. NPDC002795 TaxID=3364665 RepID=UPI0036AA49C4